METLTLGVGTFGSWATTHLFNSLDESIALWENDVQGTGPISELSAVACRPLYRETRAGKFEPNAILLDANEDVGNLPQHAYKLWSSGSDPFPSTGFDLATSARRYSDFADFILPAKQTPRIRPMRPHAENTETVQDAVRAQIETMERLDVVNLAMSPENSYNVLDFCLQEGEKSAMAIFWSFDDLSWMADLEDESSVILRDQSRLDMLESFLSIEQELKGRTAKMLLPICASQERLLNGCAPCGANFDVRRLYDRTSVAAIAMDGLSMLYRDPRAKYLTAHSQYARLIPTFCPIVAAAINFNLSGDYEPLPLTEVTEGARLADVSGLHALAPITKILDEKPNHRWSTFSWREPLLSLKEPSWLQAGIDFPEPFAISRSHSLAVRGRTLRSHFVMASPLRRERSASRLPAEGILDEGLLWIDAALRNSNVVSRGDREKWQEYREVLISLEEDLLLNLEDPFDCDSD